MAKLSEEEFLEITNLHNPRKFSDAICDLVRNESIVVLQRRQQNGLVQSLGFPAVKRDCSFPPGPPACAGSLSEAWRVDQTASDAGRALGLPGRRSLGPPWAGSGQSLGMLLRSPNRN